MTSSLAAPKSARANMSRLISLLLSLLLLTAALPTGSLSQTAQPTTNESQDFSTPSSPQATETLGAAQASVPDKCAWPMHTVSSP